MVKKKLMSFSEFYMFGTHGPKVWGMKGMKVA